MKINNKIKKSAVLTIATASILITALTMAYFVSSDSVTNRLNAQHPSIVLLEPEWDKTGQFMASRSEPGMNIPKDPYAENDGKVSEYCRIKMTVTAFGANTRENDGINGQKRLQSIIHAICMSDEPTERFVIVNNDLSIKLLNNASFALSNTDELETVVSDSDIRSVTYYFYYMGTDEFGNTNSTMKILEPEESTERLFEYVNLPIYKQDYLGIFNLNYSITLQAESVPAEIFETAPTIEEFKEQLR